MSIVENFSVEGMFYSMMHSAPDVWKNFMEVLRRVTTDNILIPSGHHINLESFLENLDNYQNKMGVYF